MQLKREINTNIIITSGGNGGILIITFLILKGGGRHESIKWPEDISSGKSYIHKNKGGK